MTHRNKKAQVLHYILDLGANTVVPHDTTDLGKLNFSPILYETKTTFLGDITPPRGIVAYVVHYKDSNIIRTIKLFYYFCFGPHLTQLMPFAMYYAEMRDKLITEVLSKKHGMTAANIIDKVSGGTPTLFNQEEEFAYKELSSLIKTILKQETQNPNSPIIECSKKIKGAKAYKLRPAKQPRIGKRKPATDVYDSSAIGKAGEFAVLAECIAAGYNASLMAVDKGIDIVASKDNIFYYIQVKTSYVDENGRVSGFGNVVYIAVVRDWVGSFKFFIFKQSHITLLIKQGFVEDSGSNINIKIEYDQVENLPYLYNGKGRSTATPFLAGIELNGNSFVL